jgi:hypothetical protein
MVSAGAPRAPVFISAPNFSPCKRLTEIMLHPGKRRWALPESLFQTVERVN